MINREIIRIKIVQLTYAYYQNGNKNIDTAEKELFFSLSKSYDLYNYLLALIVAITKEAGRRLEVIQTRAAREGEPMPSQKFILNRFALQLSENRMLQEFLANQKISWSENEVFVGQLLEQIESSDIYKEYMEDKADSYEADRELWRKLYKTFIMNNSDLDSLLEDQSLYWNDDKDIVDTFGHPQCRPVPALHERGITQLGFLASGLHGHHPHAAGHRRGHDLPQYPRQRLNQ